MINSLRSVYYHELATKFVQEYILLAVKAENIEPFYVCFNSNVSAINQF